MTYMPHALQNLARRRDSTIVAVALVVLCPCTAPVRPLSLSPPSISHLNSFCISACAVSVSMSVSVRESMLVSVPDFTFVRVPPSRAFFPRLRLNQTINLLDPSDEIHYFRPDWRFDQDRWLR